MIIQVEPNGFSASCPDLPGCFTEGETWEELMEMAEDAVTTYLSALSASGEPIAEPTHRVATIQVNVPDSKAG